MNAPDLATALNCLEIVAQDNISYALKTGDQFTKHRGEAQLFVINYLREIMGIQKEEAE